MQPQTLARGRTTGDLWAIGYYTSNGAVLDNSTDPTSVTLLNLDRLGGGFSQASLPTPTTRDSAA